MKVFAQGSYFSSHSEIGQTGIGRSAGFLLAGMAVGAGLAMLLTPRRGSEIRAAIGRACRRTWEQLTDQARDLRGRAQGMHEHVPNLIRFNQRAKSPRI